VKFGNLKGMRNSALEFSETEIVTHRRKQRLSKNSISFFGLLTLIVKSSHLQKEQFNLIKFLHKSMI
jgi:hypothetical protein